MRDLQKKSNMSAGRKEEGHPPSIALMKNFEEQKREDDLNLLSIIDKQVQGVLGELQYIAEILETNKNVAPVENLNTKIKAAYEKIKAYLDPNTNLEQVMAIEANRRTVGGIQLEQNPLVKDMGGLPLEVISSEWSQVVAGKILDKAELENLVNKKLKDRVELANRLKLQHKLSNQPKMKIGHAITPKFKKIQNTVKYILKEMPPPPKPTPARVITPPRPYGL
jgi:hypothetical protein